MSALAKTALDFCRLCMGWEHPIDRRFGEQNHNAGNGPSVAWSPYIFDYAGRHPQFHFTDLNAVKDAVQKWCDANDSAVDIGYYGYIPGEWEIQATTSASTELVQSSDLCHALLAACVQAARKLKEPA